MALKADPSFVTAVQPLLAALTAAPKFTVGDVLQRRATFAAMGSAFSQPRLPDNVEITKLDFISYDKAKVAIYRFKCREGVQGPAILHFHGGGYIAGDVEMVKASVAQQVAATGVQVFSVDYRLAPEYPHPTPVEDCYTGLLWVLSNAERFGIDPARVGLQGESAGGGLAAGTAILARDRGLHPPLAKQILIYPMIDDRSTKDLVAFGNYLIWKESDNKTGWGALLGDLQGTDRVPPCAAAARLTDFEGLPSTYVDTGSLDLFADENVAFVSKLVAANIDVEFHLYPGVPHAFEMLTPQLQVVKTAAENRSKAIKSF